MNLLKVLVVDDDPVFTVYLTETLKEWGADVLGTAETGEAAIEMAARRPPDLIFMDIQLPGALSGIDAAKKIKEALDIPVIFITAHKKDTFLDSATETHPGGFLFKPVEYWQLKASIEIAMSKHALEKELENTVRLRTAELEANNTKLNQALRDRQAFEEELEAKSEHLSEVNAALKRLIKLMDADRKEMQNRIQANIEVDIYPLLEKLKRSLPSGEHHARLQALEAHLKSIFAPLNQELSKHHARLTPTEIRVAKEIRDGKTTKEIAELLALAPSTVDAHRHHIRKKLGFDKEMGPLRYLLIAMENQTGPG